jgi:lipopolysaccharide export system protein LptC
MAKEPDSLAFRFGVVLALALIVLAATMWVAAKNAANDTAAPIPSDAIYRSQHLNLF